MTRFPLTSAIRAEFGADSREARQVYALEQWAAKRGYKYRPMKRKTHRKRRNGQQEIRFY